MHFCSRILFSVGRIFIFIFEASFYLTFHLDRYQGRTWRTPEARLSSLYPDHPQPVPLSPLPSVQKTSYHCTPFLVPFDSLAKLVEKKK